MPQGRQPNTMTISKQQKLIKTKNVKKLKSVTKHRGISNCMVDMPRRFVRFLNGRFNWF